MRVNHLDPPSLFVLYDLFYLVMATFLPLMI